MKKDHESISLGNSVATPTAKELQGLERTNCVAQFLSLFAEFTMSRKMVAVVAAIALLLGWSALPLGEAVDPDACLAPILTLRTCMQQAHLHPVGRPPACCSLFGELLNDFPHCLCDVFQGDAAVWLDIVIDVARAVDVLINCSLKIPVAYKCPSRILSLSLALPFLNFRNLSNLSLYLSAFYISIDLFIFSISFSI